MIVNRNDKTLMCDKCANFLEFPDNHILEHWRGDVIYEDTLENIFMIAKDYGWEVDEYKQICKKCK